ncbi:hypothetical protein ACFQFH_14970 [Halobaculum halobium]|uniref:hypothetical protein n=1 Tax=Halobaculum halobium TaxID=3032281 RepID=UPI0036121FF7
MLFAIVAIAPVQAQTTGTAFCETDMVATIKNVFTLIQFGGPLIGGVIALGATVALPAVSRADRKKELTEMRNQAVVWGCLWRRSGRPSSRSCSTTWSSEAPVAASNHGDAVCPPRVAGRGYSRRDDIAFARPPGERD